MAKLVRAAGVRWWPEWGGMQDHIHFGGDRDGDVNDGSLLSGFEAGQVILVDGQEGRVIRGAGPLNPYEVYSTPPVGSQITFKTRVASDGIVIWPTLGETLGGSLTIRIGSTYRRDFPLKVLRDGISFGVPFGRSIGVDGTSYGTGVVEIDDFPFEVPDRANFAGSINYMPNQWTMSDDEIIDYVMSTFDEGHVTFIGEPVIYEIGIGMSAAIGYHQANDLSWRDHPDYEEYLGRPRSEWPDGLYSRLVNHEQARGFVGSTSQYPLWVAGGSYVVVGRVVVEDEEPPPPPVGDKEPSSRLCGPGGMSMRLCGPSGPPARLCGPNG